MSNQLRLKSSWSIETQNGYEVSHSKSCKLIYTKVIDFGSCSCRLFKFKGISGRNITKYIMQRCMRAARTGRVIDKDMEDINDRYA